MGRYRLPETPKVWKHKPKSLDGLHIWRHLNQIEARLRAEIKATQVKVWTPAEIKKVYG